MAVGYTMPKHQTSLMEWLQTSRTNAGRYWKQSCKFSVERTKYKKVVVWYATTETNNLV